MSAFIRKIRVQLFLSDRLLGVAVSFRSVKPVNPIYYDSIVRDPHICGGEAVVRGTRVTVRTILASLAEGAWVDEILADFPTLNEANIRAVIAFAAASAEEDLPLSASSLSA
jgi:uncharacterized protein (DUF433 family)